MSDIRKLPIGLCVLFLLGCETQQQGGGPQSPSSQSPSSPSVSMPSSSPTMPSSGSQTSSSSSSQSGSTQQGSQTSSSSQGQTSSGTQSAGSNSGQMGQGSVDLDRKTMKLHVFLDFTTRFFLDLFFWISAPKAPIFFGFFFGFRGPPKAADFFWISQNLKKNTGHKH